MACGPRTSSPHLPFKTVAVNGVLFTVLFVPGVNHTISFPLVDPGSSYSSYLGHLEGGRRRPASRVTSAAPVHHAAVDWDCDIPKSATLALQAPAFCFSCFHRPHPRRRRRYCRSQGRVLFSGHGSYHPSCARFPQLRMAATILLFQAVG